MVICLCADRDSHQTVKVCVFTPRFWNTSVVLVSVLLLRDSLASSKSRSCLCMSKAAQTYLAMISGLGFPVAFLSAPVTTMDPATLIPNPKTPQFISHNLSAIVHAPPPPKIRLLVARGLWCEYRPSTKRVQNTMQRMGNTQEMTPAQAAEIRSGLAYGYCNDSLLSENRCLNGSAISRAEKEMMKNLEMLSVNCCCRGWNMR